MTDLQASTKVSGTQYYDAEKLYSSKKIKNGEDVKIQREPGNSYDRNAIQVLSNSGSMIGYIPKNFAAVLAPKMDAGIKVSATVKEIGRRDGDLRLRINLKYENLPTPIINKPKSSNATVITQKPISTFRKPIAPKPIAPSPVVKPQNSPKPQPTIKRDECSQPSSQRDNTDGMPWWGWAAIALIGILILGTM